MSMPIKIPCPRCRFELVCSAALLGTKGQCRNCQHIFTIAKSDTSRPVTSEFDAPEVVFHCPACAQLFAGQAEMEGKKGKCHACGEVFAIALEPAPVASTSPAVARSSAAAPTDKPTATAVVISSAQAQSPIQFHCMHCAGVMEVPASTSGRQTLCPYCGEPLTIPAMSDAVGAAVASIPVDSAASSPATTAAPASQREHNLLTALNDKSRIPLGNPHAAPTLPHHDTTSSEIWNASPRRQRPRSLSFSNAFALTFDSLFPWCLIAPLLFGVATVITLLATMLLVSVVHRTIRVLELTDGTSIQIFVNGTFACAMLVGVFAATAAYCMTCNTALHAVRGMHVSSRVVFNTGRAYGGMFAIVLGWTIFNVLQSAGVPWVMQEVAKAGDPQIANLTSVLMIGFFAMVQIGLTFLWSFVPYALLDGQGILEAMRISTSICFKHFLIVLPVLICGWLLYILVGVISIGLGLVLMLGALFYLNAAIYHLAADQLENGGRC